MKNIKQRLTQWQSDLKERCNRLSHAQRLRFILIISATYFLLAIATFVWIYFDSGKQKISIKHIQNPIPILKRGLGLDKEKEPEKDSMIVNSKNEGYGKGSK